VFFKKNKIMKKLKLIFGLCLSALIYSCNSKTIEEIQPTVIPIVAGFKPTYEKDFKPLLTASCVDCHSANGVMDQVSPYLDNYADVKASTQSTLICRLEGSVCGKLMPKGASAWPKATIDVVKLWQTQGYLEK
jgi:hypothetical protein